MLASAPDSFYNIKLTRGESLLIQNSQACVLPSEGSDLHFCGGLKEWGRLIIYYYLLTPHSTPHGVQESERGKEGFEHSRVTSSEPMEASGWPSNEQPPGSEIS